MEQDFRHNWLYSVLPVEHLTAYGQKSMLMLTGYCRACSNAFSIEIPHNFTTTKNEDIEEHLPLITNLSIPKWGCVSPGEI